MWPGGWPGMFFLLKVKLRKILMRCTPVGSPDTYRVLWIVARSLTVEGFRDLPGGAESLRHITARLLAGVARFGGGSGRR